MIGQDQGSQCGGFSKPYYGRMSQLNVWNRVLTREEVNDVYQQCASVVGNVFAWDRRKVSPHVNAPVKITATTGACESNCK